MYLVYNTVVLGRRELYRGGRKYLWSSRNCSQEEYEIIAAVGRSRWGQQRLESRISCLPPDAASGGCIVCNQGTRTNVDLRQICWIGNIKHPVNRDTQFVHPPILQSKTVRVNAAGPQAAHHFGNGSRSVGCGIQDTGHTRIVVASSVSFAAHS